MVPKLIRGWWLLALCAALDAVISVIYLLGQNGHRLRAYHTWHGTVQLVGELTLAAGICTLAVGVWNSRAGNSWLLVLNGVAGSVLGAILAFWTGALAFRTVALLIVVMALSIAAYEFVVAPLLLRHVDDFLVRIAGLISIGFAVVFLAFVLGWMKLDPRAPNQSLDWLGSYFAFTAASMLVLLARLHPPSRT